MTRTRDLASFYERMLTIRLVEDRLQGLCNEGLAGDLHFSKGQEAITVGVCSVLGEDDRVVTHHRTIAHQVALGAPLRPLIAELLGRSTGVCGGRAGEMHVSDPAIGHDFSFQLVGTAVPVAAGLAWALRTFKKSSGVVAAFLGDAATANGQFHEGLNIAAVHRLPLLIVVEDNHLAGNIGPENYQPEHVRHAVGRRAQGYGIKYWQADGNDVSRVVQAASEVLESIKVRGGPYVLVLETERLCWHKQGQRDVRSAEVLAEFAKGDPLTRIGLSLSREVSEAIAARVRAVVDEAFELALADPFPEEIR